MCSCLLHSNRTWLDDKDIIIHENGKDGIAILGYHGVVSEQEKRKLCIKSLFYVYK